MLVPTYNTAARLFPFVFTGRGDNAFPVPIRMRGRNHRFAKHVAAVQTSLRTLTLFAACFLYCYYPSAILVPAPGDCSRKLLPALKAGGCFLAHLCTRWLRYCLVISHFMGTGWNPLHLREGALRAYACTLPLQRTGNKFIFYPTAVSMRLLSHDLRQTFATIPTCLNRQPSRCTGRLHFKYPVSVVVPIQLKQLCFFKIAKTALPSFHSLYRASGIRKIYPIIPLMVARFRISCF